MLYLTILFLVVSVKMSEDANTDMYVDRYDIECPVTATLAEGENVRNMLKGCWVFVQVNAYAHVIQGAKRAVLAVLTSWARHTADDLAVQQISKCFCVYVSL
jgi:hypothetical protein